jgi:hypothetical protein
VHHIPDLTPLKDAPVAPLPSQPATPLQTDGQPFRDCATCPELVTIAPGRFVMGAGSEGLGQQVSAITTQDVAIAAPFAIGRYEITFDEWSQCVTDGGCTSQPADENWGRGRRPVINVSFNDITQQYLPWLSRKTGFTYRLRWRLNEFAARGGISARQGLAYSFAITVRRFLCLWKFLRPCRPNTDANWTGINRNDGYAASACGSLKPNQLVFSTCMAMSGNEADCWQPQYSAKPAKPGELAFVSYAAVWASAAQPCALPHGLGEADKFKNSIGFRVARQQPKIVCRRGVEHCDEKIFHFLITYISFTCVFYIRAVHCDCHTSQGPGDDFGSFGGGRSCRS